MAPGCTVILHSLQELSLCDIETARGLSSDSLSLIADVRARLTAETACPHASYTQGVRANGTLRRLNLKRTNVSVSSAVTYSHHLVPLHMPTSLPRQLDDAGVYALATAMSESSCRITDLDVSCNHIREVSHTMDACWNRKIPNHSPVLPMQAAGALVTSKVIENLVRAHAPRLYCRIILMAAHAHAEPESQPFGRQLVCGNYAGIGHQQNAAAPRHDVRSHRCDLTSHTPLIRHPRSQRRCMAVQQGKAAVRSAVPQPHSAG